jgi:hypothetical protein
MYSIVFYRVILVWLALAGTLGLSGCAVYDAVFHPHRLGTPAMTPEAKAKLRAAEKARHKGLSLQPATDDETAGTGGTTPGPSTTPTNVSNSKAYSELPAGTRATYDKHLLLKKSLLVRLQQNRNKLHHYDLSAPKHTDATRDERKMRKHSKTSGKRGAEPKAPAEPVPAAEPAPAPDPTQPTAPAAAAPSQPSKAARPAARTLPPRPAKVAPKPRTPSPTAPAATAPDTANAKPAAEPVALPAPAPKAKKDKKAPKAPKPDPTQPLPSDGQ